MDDYRKKREVAGLRRYANWLRKQAMRLQPQSEGVDRTLFQRAIELRHSEDELERIVEAMNASTVWMFLSHPFAEHATAAISARLQAIHRLLAEGRG